ncbi:MAG TPA: glycoside hydrolase family 172 protein [Chitinophagaceae bacterium]|nr:glycoside hydrolase family 172 protein [Chitinophagaceae bacterium]
MRSPKFAMFFTCLLFAVNTTINAQNKLYEFDNNALSSRWSSPENLNGNKGAGGAENNTAKGHAFDAIEAGATKSLLNVQGTGVINRIWITIDNRSPEMLRSLKIEIFWDNESKPAVSVPFGDFFATALSKTSTFQNSLFVSPEGRSFVCLIPMPFKKAAKVVVVNESAKSLTHIFFDIDFQYLKAWQPQFMYFHAYWHRDTATTLARDFELLPAIKGKGRYLGASIGINSNPLYGDSWWGEGEVKMYIDGDKDLPTIVGTGTEDYIGTGWGQGEFINNYSGCLIADSKAKQWAYYRYHVPDPIFFNNNCKVTLQQIGGNGIEKVEELQKAGVPLIPVTLDNGNKFYPLYKKDGGIELGGASLPGGWLNFYRSDDVSATAYFYLDTPSDNLPPLQPLSLRLYNLKTK